MKLVIAAEIFPPDIGGPATYSQKLAVELTNRDWQVKLICYSAKMQSDNCAFPIFRILRRANPLKHYLNYFWTLLKLAKDCDVIYAQGPVSSGLPAVIVGKILRKKVAVKVVGDYAWEQARNSQQTDLGIDEFQAKKFTGKIGRLQSIERRVCQKANKVVVPSQYLKKIVKGWGIGEDKIEVIYNSFEAPELKSKKPTDKNLIISAGRLVPWKGFDTLISLMPELLKENPNFKLKIFGFGPEKEKLEKLIKAYNLSNSVAIISLSHDQLLEELSAAGIFILNSGYEGLSHVILEAMSLDVLTAASHVGGNSELITNDFNGYLFEYNNRDEIKKAIMNSYNYPKASDRFIINSKKLLEKFTFKEMISKTIKTLESA